MQKKIVYLFIFCLGMAAGATLFWIHSYSTKTRVNHQAPTIGDILAHANTPISPAHNACEGKPVNTVGDVVASLLEQNTLDSHNRLNYGCYDNTCTVSVSDCKPWQQQECGSRFLTFQRDNQKNIDSQSFNCFDMP